MWDCVVRGPSVLRSVKRERGITPYWGRQTLKYLWLRFNSVILYKHAIRKATVCLSSHQYIFFLLNVYRASPTVSLLCVFIVCNLQPTRNINTGLSICRSCNGYCIHHKETSFWPKFLCLQNVSLASCMQRWLCPDLLSYDCQKSKWHVFYHYTLRYFMFLCFILKLKLTIYEYMVLPILYCVKLSLCRKGSSLYCSRTECCGEWTLMKRQEAGKTAKRRIYSVHLLANVTGCEIKVSEISAERDATF
jgi:hypothetical protein